MKYTDTDQRSTPVRPARVVSATGATPVASAPRATSARAGQGFRIAVREADQGQREDHDRRHGQNGDPRPVGARNRLAGGWNRRDRSEPEQEAAEGDGTGRVRTQGYGDEEERGSETRGRQAE